VNIFVCFWESYITHEHFHSFYAYCPNESRCWWEAALANCPIEAANRGLATRSLTMNAFKKKTLKRWTSNLVTFQKSTLISSTWHDIAQGASRSLRLSWNSHFDKHFFKILHFPHFKPVAEIFLRYFFLLLNLKLGISTMWPLLYWPL